MAVKTVCDREEDTMSIELDRLFFRNFTLVVVLLAVMMCVFGVIASWAAGYA